MPRLPAPETIGRYRVEAEVGRGGMGVVYRAFDPALRRRVAVKLIAPHLAEEPTLLARFQREAASAAQLRHPNIATVYEYGEHEGTPFIAFEWVEGRTLKALLADEAPLPLERALRLLEPIGAALDHAHARGVIHRDVKPGNILVGADDHPVIIDFGLAWLGSATALTASGSFFGTPRYMSPEQIQGLQVDGRSDLYSLAVILFEALAGEPPFDADTTPALLHKQLHSPPPRLRTLRADLPARVEAAVERGLAKDPQKRLPTAASLMQAMRAPPAGVERRRPRRWPVVLVAGAVGLTAIVCALGALSGATPESTPEATESAATATTGETLPPEPTEPLPSEPPSFPPPDPSGWWPMTGGDSTQMGAVYAGLGPLDANPRWIQPLDPDEVPTGLAAGGGLVFQGASRAAGGGMLRARLWETGELFWEAPLAGGVTAAPVLHATQSIFYAIVAVDTWELTAFDAAGTPVWNLGPDALLGHGAGGPVISPDGILYLATDTGLLHAIDPATGGVLATADLTGIDGFYFPPAVGGRTLALVGAQRTLTVVDRATLVPQWTATLGSDPSVPPVLLEGTDQVWSGTYDGVVEAWSLSTGELLWQFGAPSGIAGLSSDGGLVYVACGVGEVVALDPATGAVVWETHAEAQLASRPMSDGTAVALATLAGQVRFLEAATGTEVADRRLDLADPIGVNPAPAGGWLFVSGASGMYAFGPP